MDDRDACDGYKKRKKSCYLPLHLYDMFDQTTFACENTYIPTFPPLRVLSVMYPVSTTNSPSENTLNLKTEQRT